MAVFDDFSFREKSLLVSLLAVLVVYGGYFADLVGGALEPSLGAMLKTCIAVVIALIVIEVSLHIVLAIFDVGDAEAPRDERDQLISGRAARISHWVLSAGVLIVLVRVVVRGAMDESSGLEEVTLFEVANLLLLIFVVSELVSYGAQLVFYRRGI